MLWKVFKDKLVKDIVKVKYNQEVESEDFANND